MAAFTPLDLGYIGAIWVETALYGAYLVLYGLCVYTLVVRRRRAGRTGALPTPVLGSISAMVLFSSIHVAIGLARLMRGFREFAEGRAFPGTLAVYMGNESWVNILKEATYTCNTVTADGLLIWRLWTIWGRDLRIVSLPLLLLGCTAACGFGSTVSFAIAGPVGSLRQTLFIKTINAWVLAFFVFTLATNVFSTVAIAVRILKFMPEHIPGRTVERRAYIQMVAVVLESGLLYSATMLSLLIMWLAGSSAQYLAVDATMPIACIVPTLIVIRVGMGLQWEKAKLVAPGTVQSVGIDFNFLTAPSFRDAQTQTGPSGYDAADMCSVLSYEHDSNSSRSRCHDYYV
ncbi:hypothetical protein AURDEDRAFT_188197 [Auricularia subglabra TFB-10046 SS5]|uniref:Uncharacterized protein n=1 Tax=Auricularia subglabra (strain TFB-10046 / SS5) TaxID=717982 RepID=J0WTT7_AURST|nr:hypothetical protein AURDEDRAFT_188197 [Auricularia subglabra TFB-10046 SS5]